MQVKTPSMKSAMQHNFGKVPVIGIDRSTFHAPFSHKTTMDAGYLVPLWVRPVLPGSTLKMRMSVLARFNTPIFPLMDNMKLDLHHWFVPSRILWDNFNFFMGENYDPEVTPTEYLLPEVDAPTGGWVYPSVGNYFGIPYGKEIAVDALPFRAYNMIYREWYRPQQIIAAPLVNNSSDGPDDPADYALLRRAKGYDYFTQALKQPQAGDPVLLPLTGNAPIIGFGKLNNVWTTGAGTFYETDDATANAFGTYQQVTDPNNFHFAVQESATVDGVPGMYADLSAVTAVEVNQFRFALQMQSLLELENRTGQRLPEIIYGSFGVLSPDSRLQRPEYLGGGSFPVNIYSVPQTSATETGKPQGNLAAYAFSLAVGSGYNKSFTEWGYVMSIGSIVADLTYSQGLDRWWSRRSKYDFPWPMLSNIGEQAILTKEIFTASEPAGEAANNVVFGYVPRYDEERFNKSLITGLMAPDAPANLAAWHLSEDFADAPVLDADFMNVNPPVSRVVAVTTQPHFTVDVFGDVTMTQPLPMHGIPGYLGRL